MTSTLPQPIVIFGGFLSYPMLYQSMRRALEAVSGCPVSVVPTHSLDWLSSVSFSEVARLLDKLHRTACQAAASSSTGKITLVGHSAGGVFSRLYLSPEPFAGRRYAGLQTRRPPDHPGQPASQPGRPDPWRAHLALRRPALAGGVF